MEEGDDRDLGLPRIRMRMHCGESHARTQPAIFFREERDVTKLPGGSCGVLQSAPPVDG